MQTKTDRILRYVLFNLIPAKMQEERFLKDASYRPMLTFMEQPKNRGRGPVLPQKPSRRHQAQKQLAETTEPRLTVEYRET